MKKVKCVLIGEQKIYPKSVIVSEDAVSILFTDKTTEMYFKRKGSE